MLKPIVSIAIITVSILLFATQANSNTVHWFWMSPNVNLATTEVIRYDVDNLNSETWMDDLQLVNQFIGRAAIENRFSNLQQLEVIVNQYLRNEKIGSNFRVIDVERVDLLRQ